MLIDSHLHIGLNSWTEDYLLNYLDRNGIEKAWILTWDELNPVSPDYYIPLDINVVKKAFRNHPDRIVPFYAPDPGRISWKEDLQRCLDEGFAGCAELKVSYRWDDPVMQPLLEFLDQNKLPIVFHMERERKLYIPDKDRGLDWLLKRLINERYNGRSASFIESVSRNTGILKKYISERSRHFPGYLQDFNALEKSLTDFPGIKFIGHGPHIWNHYSVPLRDNRFHQIGKFRGPGILWRLLSDYSNFYCDISGFSGFNAMNRDHQVTKKFLSDHYMKILFGTDNSELGLFKLVESLGLEDEKKYHIYYKNALAIVT